MKCSCGRNILFDDSIFETAKYRRWSCSEGKYTPRTFWDKYTYLTAAQFVWETPNRLDHIDGNDHNNQRLNLREATKQQNCQNRSAKIGKQIPYKGVYQRRPNSPFFWKVFVNRICVAEGISATVEQAALAYNKAAIKHHGEFARINVIGKPGHTRSILPRSGDFIQNALNQ